MLLIFSKPQTTHSESLLCLLVSLTYSIACFSLRVRSSYKILFKVIIYNFYIHFNVGFPLPDTLNNTATDAHNAYSYSLV